MTIPARETAITNHVGNGSASTFDYEFKISAETDLVVTQTDLAGVSTVLTLTTDYTVTGVGADAGGNITLVAGALASGYQLSIEDDVEISQLTPYGNQSAFFAQNHENSFDKVTRIGRKALTQVARAIQVGPTVTADPTLPDPVSLNLFRWNQGATALENVTADEIATTVAFSDFETDTYVDGTDFTAGSTTFLTLSSVPGIKANTWVYFDGEYQEKSGYSILGAVITFTAPIPIATTTVEIVHGTAKQPTDPSIGVTIRHERIVATAGQTIFDLSTTYLTGANAVAVFVNGERRSPDEYTETDNNTITLSVAASLNDNVDFYIGASVTTVNVASSGIRYEQTNEEVAAGVAPVDYQYPVGHAFRYGALGIGSSNDDTIALNNAILAASYGIGFVYMPATANFYNITQPLFMRDGVTLIGDGYLTHLRNTRTVSALDGDLRCVDFGNHTVASLLAETSYALDNATRGDKFVTTTTAADAGNFSAGQVVYIGSTTLAGSVPSVQEFNEVESVDAGTGVVTLKYGLHESFTGGQNIYTTTSSQTDPMGRARRVVKNIAVRNMRVTSDGGDWWHAAGGCWESVFENLSIESRAPAVLNCFARSRMSNIYGTFGDRAVEFAIGSHHSVFESFDLTFKDTGQATASEPLLSVGEGAHNIQIRDGYVNASDHAGTRCMRFITSKDCTLDNVTFEAPNLSGSAMIDFSASVGYCQRNLANKITATGPNSRYIQFDYGASVTGEENRVTNSKFFGALTDDAVVFVDGTRDFVADNYFESGGYDVGAGSTNCSIQRCEFEERHPTRVVSAACDLRDITSGSTSDLRIAEQFEVNNSITSTTPNNTVYTVTIPLDTLEIGDMIDIEVSGLVSGATSTKDIVVEAEATDIASISLAAGQSGAFSIKATLAVMFTTTTKRAIAQEESAAGSNTRRTTFSLNTTTNTMNIDLEAWVGNAADSITIDRYVVRPVRQHELTP